MNAICKLNGAIITWPCAAYGCPLFGDCFVEWEKERGFAKSLTNADRIRAMSDEALASALVKYEGTEKRRTPYGGHKHIFYGPNGEECGTREYAVTLWADWLQQPAEEDDHA